MNMEVRNMRTPLTITRRNALGELNQALKRKHSIRTQLRIRAVLAVAKGWKVPKVAQALTLKERAIRNWIHQYNQCGLEGLRDHWQGRAAGLSPPQQELLQRRIEAGPRPQDGVCALRGEDIRRILRDEFGLSYSLNGVYYILHQELGMSYLKPRPRHHQADSSAQEAFKKTFPRSWKICKDGTQTNG
jgi:transposase